MDQDGTWGRLVKFPASFKKENVSDAQEFIDSQKELIRKLTFNLFVRPVSDAGLRNGDLKAVSGKQAVGE